MKKRILVFTLSLLVSPVTFAGPGDHGGGNIVISPGQHARFLDLVKVPTTMILDQTTEPGHQTLIDMMNANPAFGETTYLPAICIVYHDLESSVTLQTKILQALHGLTFYLVQGPLPALNDMGIVELNRKDHDGKIRRFALQSEDERKVMVDRDLFEDMKADAIDIAAFFLHEALIRVYWDSNFRIPLRNTEKIGNFVHVAFDRGHSPLITMRTMAKYFKDLGIPSIPDPGHLYLDYQPETMARFQTLLGGKEFLGERIYFSRDRQKLYVLHGQNVVFQKVSDNNSIKTYVAHAFEGSDGNIPFDISIEEGRFGFSAIIDSAGIYERLTYPWGNQGIFLRKKP